MLNGGTVHSNFLNTAQITEVAEVGLDREAILSDFGQRFVGFGSCFAQNLRRHLEAFGFNFFFNSEISAHYNTETLANILEFIEGKRHPSEDDLYNVGDEDVFLYRCNFKHRFYGPGAAERALERMRGLIASARNALEGADCVLITLGTARVLRLHSNGEVLAAVVGVDQAHWKLDFLPVEANLANLRRVIASLKRSRRDRPLTVFVTVSPQRYLFGHVMKPGQKSYEGTALVDNFLSKSVLRVAVDELVKEDHGSVVVKYFPAFEIVYEELRQFETLSHYDFVHIDQVHTPERVVKKFLQAYASDAVLDQLVATTEVRSALHEMGRLLNGGMDRSHPEIQRRVDGMLARMAAFGEELTPPMIGITYHLLQNYRPGTSISDLAFRHMGYGNRLAIAKEAAARQDFDLARRLVGDLLREIEGRRTMDPDAGRDIEHHVYDEAVQLLRQWG